MAKRSRDGHPIQPVPLAIRPATRSSTPSQTMSPTPAPQSTAAPEGYQGTLKASSFWVQEGMTTFFDWITNPYNHERLYKKNPISGQKPKDVRQEIANVVNNKHNTKWTEGQVKSKIAYVKSKYREAAKKNSTGEGAQVSNEQLEVCPEFLRLHEVYGGSLSANPLPPKQTADFGEAHTAPEFTDEDSSDFEDPSDTDSHTGMKVHHQIPENMSTGLIIFFIPSRFPVQASQQASERQWRLISGRICIIY